VSAREAIAGTAKRKRAIAIGVAVIIVGLAAGWLTRSDTVRYCSGQDVSATQRRSVEDFNASNARGTSKATLDDGFSANANEQRQRYRDALVDGKCDVVFMDVAYMPEFAADGLLVDMTAYLREHQRAKRFDRQMMQTVEWAGRRWGVPKHLDGGVLFYRKDKVRTAPGTWQEVFKKASENRARAPDGHPLPGLRLPLEGYEGLTAIILEFAYGAGAKPIVSDDGRHANLDQPQVLEVLTTLRDAIATGAIPRTGVKSFEKGTIDVFRIGRARFLRNWVYAESLIRREARNNERLARIAGTIMPITLPPWKVGEESTSILGGHDLVIPKTAKNPDGAKRLIEFLTTREQFERDAREGSLAPALDGWRADAAVRSSKALSALAETRLRTRPIIPQYADVSGVISDEVRLLLGNARPPTDHAIRTALARMQREIANLLG
jgi:multiple sugar transport system substrate-binding protein